MSAEDTRNWDEKHQMLYLDMKNEDPVELLKKLVRYRNAANDPHLSQYPPDMIEKTKAVIEYLLTEDHDIADIDQAIEDAEYFGVI